MNKDQAIKFIDHLVVVKNYSISDISRHSGIARSTLYAIWHNKNDKIYLSISKKLDAMAEKLGYIPS